MSNLYLDPNGKTITFREWKKRIPAEYRLHEHTTAKSITRLLAADIIMDANLIPEVRHKRYKMESTNILTKDAMGEPYPEPKYVEDEFAAKSFATKEQAIGAYIDFLVEWCGGDRSSLAAKLSKEVPVTKVEPVEIKVKDMELHSLSRRTPAMTAPAVDPDDDDHIDPDDESDGTHPSDKPKGGKKSAAAAPAPKTEDKPKAALSDAPKTVIFDDIGSW
jgi:hypothetical protein